MQGLAPVADIRERHENAVEIFALASFGGHFEQLLQLREAWAGRPTLYVSTRRDSIAELRGQRVAFVSDCHAGQVIRAAICLAQLARLFGRHRPRILVTTGALPGLLAAAVARAVGTRVIWIDSVANSERLSTSGSSAKRFAHHHFSQWPGVAERDGSSYGGTVF
jgi:hypothetical protein